MERPDHQYYAGEHKRRMNEWPHKVPCEGQCGRVINVEYTFRPEFGLVMCDICSVQLAHWIKLKMEETIQALTDLSPFRKRRRRYERYLLTGHRCDEGSIECEPYCRPKEGYERVPEGTDRTK
jgi:hypothetical protein